MQPLRQRRPRSGSQSTPPPPAAPTTHPWPRRGRCAPWQRRRLPWLRRCGASRRCRRARLSSSRGRPHDAQLQLGQHDVVANTRMGESSSASLRRPARCSLRSTAPGALLCALCLRQFRRSRPRSANSPHAFFPPPCAHPRAPCAPKSSSWRKHHLVSLAHTALQEGQVDWECLEPVRAAGAHNHLLQR
eukprot:COSAG06_NODE_971_length_11273_cov_54.583497_12_plen_189_part_00